MNAFTLKQFIIYFLLGLLCLQGSAAADVVPGIEKLVTPEYRVHIENKRIGLITNQTGVTRHLEANVDFLLRYREPLNLQIAALFAPEHGIDGAQHAAEDVADSKRNEIPIYSLHGKNRRPTREMLKGIDVLVFDMQDVGSRSYTYSTTLFYVMEEAAKLGIPVVVADRPNPINGLVVDGPMLDPKWRSFIGYINVPYCHGMTIGELAQFFNREYDVGCRLSVVPMTGWSRSMTYVETGLPWVPTSPNIPESTTPLYYPMTGILGELQLVNIGIGFTLPFKVVGAPWIEAQQLAAKLNAQKLPGVMFSPIHYKPYSGKFSKKEVEGVLIFVSDPTRFQPVATQYMIIGLLKSLYPKQFKEALAKTKQSRELFNKVNGTERPLKLMETNPYPGWSLREIDQKERTHFLAKRKQYLIY